MIFVYFELLIVYGKKMCEKYPSQRYHHKWHVLGPKYCQDEIRVINKLAAANEHAGPFENPTLASSLNTLLK